MSFEPQPEKKETPAATGAPHEERHNTQMSTEFTLSDVDREQAHYFAMRLLADALDAPPRIVPDDTARTRKTDPQESHDAADRSQRTLPAVRRAVLELLSIHKELTGSEINDLYSLTAHEMGWPRTKTDTPRKRTSELIADGYVEVVGRRGGERVLALSELGRKQVA